MALNKESKRRSASVLPFMQLLPVADGTIGKADRRMLAGVYWGFLDTGLKLGGSLNYADAKAIYDGEDRFFAGTLPHNLLWLSTGGLTDQDRLDFLSTGFYAVPCNSASSLDDPEEFVGDQELGEFVAGNPDLPITLRTIWNLLAQADDDPDGVDLVADIYACFSTLGAHIGSEVALSTCNPDPEIAVLALFRYRFQIGCTIGNPRPVDRDSTRLSPLLLRVPVFPEDAIGKNGLPIDVDGETLTFWAKCTELIWQGHPNRGEIIATTLLDDFDVDVADRPGGAGLILDFEDYIKDARDTSPQGEKGENPTTKTVFDEDPRWDLASKVAAGNELNNRYIGAMLDARLAKLVGLATWADPLLTTLYDYNHHWAGEFITAFTKTAEGRNRASIDIYGFQQDLSKDPPADDPIEDALMHLGERVVQLRGKRPVSADVFDFWFNSSLQDVINSKEPWTPRGWDKMIPFMWNVVESVIFMQCAMAWGAWRLQLWRKEVHPAHPYFSILVAFDNMQPYADFIKNGITYVPPPGISRTIKDPSSGIENASYRQTPFYMLDVNGYQLPGDVFICCRVLGNRMMFYGCRTAGATNSYRVTAPDGTSYPVKVSRYGNVSILGT